MTFKGWRPPSGKKPLIDSCENVRARFEREDTKNEDPKDDRRGGEPPANDGAGPAADPAEGVAQDPCCGTSSAGAPDDRPLQRAGEPQGAPAAGDMREDSRAPGSPAEPPTTPEAGSGGAPSPSAPARASAEQFDQLCDLLARAPEEITNEQLAFTARREAMRILGISASTPDTEQAIGAAAMILCGQWTGYIAWRPLAQLLDLPRGFAHDVGRRLNSSGIWKRGRKPGMSDRWLAQLEGQRSGLIFNLLVLVAVGQIDVDFPSGVAEPKFKMTEAGSASVERMGVGRAG